MDDEAAVKVKKVTNTIIFQATPIRVSVSLLAIFLLMWIIRTGFGVVTEAEMETRSSNWGFHFGVVTLLFGILFVALGLPILTNLFLKLSEQLQKHDETSIYPDILTKAGGGEMKPIHTIVGRILVTLITMVMLAWASYTGYRLATEPRRDDKYYPLIFPIGIVTIVFGSVYIIIGLGLIADLALALTVQLLLRKKKGVIAHQDPNTEAKSFV